MLQCNRYVKTHFSKRQRKALKALVLSLERIYPKAAFITHAALSRTSRVKLLTGMHQSPPHDPHFHITVRVEEKRRAPRTCRIYIDPVLSFPEDFLMLASRGPGPDGEPVSIEDELRPGRSWL